MTPLDLDSARRVAKDERIALCHSGAHSCIGPCPAVLAKLVERLAGEVERMHDAIQHVVYRNHEATSACSRCEAARAFVEDSAASAPGAVPSRHEQPRAIASAQAEDEGLWFDATTAPEAYLQQELRRLHAAIEGEWAPGATEEES